MQNCADVGCIFFSESGAQKKIPAGAGGFGNFAVTEWPQNRTATGTEVAVQRLGHMMRENLRSEPCCYKGRCRIPFVPFLHRTNFALGIEGLDRFVRREPLRRVHECVFGVLALESKPVDPRL
jgi:hypothetical protein